MSSQTRRHHDTRLIVLVFMPGHQMCGGDRFLVLHDVFRQRRMWLVAVFVNETVGLMDLALNSAKEAVPASELAAGSRREVAFLQEADGRQSSDENTSRLSAFAPTRPCQGNTPSLQSRTAEISVAN